MMNPQISAALANEHRNMLLTEASERRLARQARSSRSSVPTAELQVRTRAETTVTTAKRSGSFKRLLTALFGTRPELTRRPDQWAV
jgi:hypothetical protein